MSVAKLVPWMLLMPVSDIPQPLSCHEVSRDPNKLSRGVCRTLLLPPLTPLVPRTFRNLNMLPC